jgi:hypothetical protein
MLCLVEMFKALRKSSLLIITYLYPTYGEDEPITRVHLKES